MLGIFHPCYANRTHIPGVYLFPIMLTPRIKTASYTTNKDCLLLLLLLLLLLPMLSLKCITMSRVVHLFVNAQDVIYSARGRHNGMARFEQDSVRSCLPHASPRFPRTAGTACQMPFHPKLFHPKTAFAAEQVFLRTHPTRRQASSRRTVPMHLPKTKPRVGTLAHVLTAHAHTLPRLHACALTNKHTRVHARTQRTC